MNNPVLSLYLSFRALWVDQITSAKQARQIIQQSSRYAFWYWLISCSLFNNQFQKMKGEWRLVDPSALTPFGKLIMSPIFTISALTILMVALICTYVMKKKDSKSAAVLLLILWSFQAWFRTSYVAPSLVWTPLFIFIVWTTARGVLAVFKVSEFAKRKG